MGTYKTFETDRLLLKPTALKDAEFYFRLFNTPKWLQFIGDRGIRTVADAEKYIRIRMFPQLKRLGFCSYTLFRKVDMEKIGSCGLYEREGLEGVDIGFAFLPEYEKQGFAFEAANRLKQAAFEDFRLPFLNGITLAENLNSQRLLEKLGLKYRSKVKLPDDDEELLLYRLEYQEAQKGHF